MTGRALAVTGLLAAAVAACGVKAPPRPPVGATQAPAAAVQETAPGAGADALPGNDCGKKAPTGQETQP